MKLKVSHMTCFNYQNEDFRQDILNRSLNKNPLLVNAIAD